MPLEFLLREEVRMSGVPDVLRSLKKLDAVKQRRAAAILGALLADAASKLANP